MVWGCIEPPDRSRPYIGLNAFGCQCWSNSLLNYPYVHIHVCFIYNIELHYVATVYCPISFFMYLCSAHWSSCSFIYKTAAFQSADLMTWPTGVRDGAESIATLHPFVPQRAILVFPDFQPMRASEESVYIYLFQQNLVSTTMHLRSPVHFPPPQE